MSGHCRHCCDECPGGTPIPAWPNPEPHINDDGAEWPSGACPACTERDRIAAAIEAAAALQWHNTEPDEWDDRIDGYHDGLVDAAKIARGDE